MEPTKGRFEVEKFDGEGDFALWKHKMMAQFEILGLDSVLQPEEDDLKGKGVVGDGSDAKPKDPKWLEKDRRVRNLLSMSLSDMVLRKVIKSKSALEMWTALEATYQIKSLPNRFYLKQRFYSYKMEDDKNLDKNLDVFTKLVSDLASLDVELSEEDQAVILLNSLPRRFEPLVHTLNYGRDQETITLKEITRAAYSIELDMKAKGRSGSSGTSGEGLYFQSRGRSEKKTTSKVKSNSRSKSRPKFKKTCWVCGVEGHFKQECPKRNKSNGSVKAEASVGKAEYDEPLMVTASCHLNREGWVLDSGCSYHMTFRRDLMFDVEEINGGKILMGNDTFCEITAIGKVKFVNYNKSEVILTGVRYSESARRNLISLGQLETLGCWFQSKDYRLKVFKGDSEVLAADYKETLYFLDGVPVAGEVNSVDGSLDITSLWHSRLGHMSVKGMQCLVKSGFLEGVDITTKESCEHCILGKFHKLSFKKGKHNSEEPLAYVHSDLWGSPNVTPSLSKCHYYISFVDDYSRKIWLYFLKTKDEVFSKFVEWLALVENQSGKSLKALRTDNGLEYCNKTFDDFCKGKGILRHKTCPYTPQQNGVAERLNRTILEKVRSLLSETGLGEEFWAEASSTVAYMINRTPSIPLELKVPEEVWSGRKPEYDHMRRFGCLVYYHVDQGKLKPRAKKGVFMGYPQGVKGYRIWSLEEKKIVINRNVLFHEDVVFKDIEKHSDVFTVVAKNKKRVSFLLPEDEVTDEHTGSSSEGGVSRNTEGEVDSDDEAEKEDSPTDLKNYMLARDRTKRTIKPPSRFDDADVAAYALVMSELVEEDEPLNFGEAIRSKNGKKWRKASDEEMDSLVKNHTWVLIDRPEGERTIDCRWIYKVKPGIPGVEDKRYKGRVVAKGYSQIEGIDYHEVFSPVFKHVTIRLLLSMVVHQNLELEQLDVKTAFLHGNLEERILMEQPEGYKKGNKVCLLKKSIYGLKQSPRQWNRRFDEFMRSQGYERSLYDSCAYFKVYGNWNMIYLLLYVDDMLVAARDVKEVQKLKDLLSSEFEMKDLGPAKRILGMDICRDREEGVLTLSQGTYLCKVLRNFMMEESKSVSTPMGSHFKLSSTKAELRSELQEAMESVPYSSAVGSLMYSMIGTRPDIAYGVGLVSRFMSAPGQDHWNAVKWLMRYIRGTTDMALTFKKSEVFEVKGYCDSDYASDLDRRRSITGYVFQVGGNTVSWRSGLQHIVALSTTEAEYMALVEATKEALWLKGITSEFGFEQKKAEIFCDSQSALCLARNSVFHERTKHIDVRLHFTRDVVADGSIVVSKIGTVENPADILTKNVPVKKFEEGRSLMRVIVSGN